jgi:hypothetical protein
MTSPLRVTAIALAALAIGLSSATCNKNYSAVVEQANTRFTAHDAVPFPGTSDPKELLANIQYSVWKSKLYGSGLEAVFDPNAVTLAQIVAVECPQTGDYFIVDLEATGEQPLARMIVKKETGFWAAAGWWRVRPEPDLRARLDRVALELKQRYRAGRAWYFSPGFNNLSVGLDFNPLIAADTPDGRIMVTPEQRVFQESGFEPDPPGLSAEERQQLRQRQVNAKPVYFIATDDGFLRFRNIGVLDVKRH